MNILNIRETEEIVRFDIQVTDAIGSCFTDNCMAELRSEALVTIKSENKVLGYSFVSEIHTSS